MNSNIHAMRKMHDSAFTVRSIQNRQGVFIMSLPSQGSAGTLSIGGRAILTNYCC